jgi:hypothetical protein
MISFKVNATERTLLRFISMRAYGENLIADQTELEMDLAATHANGCPLDFAKLLAFDDFNFGHDIRGIQGHIDRRVTGKLMNCFLPRCAKPVTAKRSRKKEAA